MQKKAAVGRRQETNRREVEVWQKVPGVIGTGMPRIAEGREGWQACSCKQALSSRSRAWEYHHSIGLKGSWFDSHHPKHIIVPIVVGRCVV